MIGAARLFAAGGAAREPAAAGRPDLLLVSDLKQALRQPGCPLCRLLREADRRYIGTFLRESKDDGRMLVRLLGCWGLCARHASALAHLEPLERGDGLGTGTLYDWLLDQARRLLEEFRRELDPDPRAGPPARRRSRRSERRRERLLSWLGRRGACPACDDQRWYAEYVVDGFLRALEPAAGLPAIQEMYRASDGLCLPHWRATRGLRSSPGIRDLVTDKQREVVAALKAALDAELERGVGAEPGEGGTGEASAVRRALATVAGDTAWHPSPR